MAKDNFTEIKDTLRSNLLRLVEQKHITMSGLSLSSDHRSNYISQILSGKSNPSLEGLCQLADSLDTTVCDLITPVEVSSPDLPTGKKKKIRELSDILVELPEDNIDLFLAMAKAARNAQGKNNKQST